MSDKSASSIFCISVGLLFIYLLERQKKIKKMHIKDFHKNEESLYHEIFSPIKHQSEMDASAKDIGLSLIHISALTNVGEFSLVLIPFMQEILSLIHI